MDHIENIFSQQHLCSCAYPLHRERVYRVRSLGTIVHSGLLRICRLAMETCLPSRYLETGLYATVHLGYM
jgi:hypothetical protein